MGDRNPIVDEVRAARDTIAKKCDYDIAKIAESIRERERQSGRTFVRLPPKRPTVARKVG
jgi:hypothetical protein